MRQNPFKTLPKWEGERNEIYISPFEKGGQRGIFFISLKKGD